MVNHKTVASRVGLIGSLISLLILSMVSVTFKNTAVLEEETNPVRSVCTYMSIPYLDDVVVNICMDSKQQPISMASVNDSVNEESRRMILIPLEEYNSLVIIKITPNQITPIQKALNLRVNSMIMMMMMMMMKI